MKCHRCGEPWEAGALGPDERRRLREGDGCPACAWGTQCPACAGTGLESLDPAACCANGAAVAERLSDGPAWTWRGRLLDRAPGPAPGHGRRVFMRRTVAPDGRTEAAEYLVACPVCGGNGPHLVRCHRCGGTGRPPRKGGGILRARIGARKGGNR